MYSSFLFSHVEPALDELKWENGGAAATPRRGSVGSAASQFSPEVYLKRDGDPKSHNTILGRETERLLRLNVPLGNTERQESRTETHKGAHSGGESCSGGLGAAVKYPGVEYGR